MEPKYINLQKPLKVRGHVLKNRLEASNSLPHFLQGPESYPADSVIAHFENKARGAAIVSCMGINNFTRGKPLPMEIDFSHFPDYDLYDPCSQNYLLQTADAIHFFDSIACMNIFVGPPSAYPLRRWKAGGRVKQDNVNGTEKHDPMAPFGKAVVEEFDLEMIDGHKLPEEYTEEELDKIARSYAEQCTILKSLDFDMANLHFAYRANPPGKFMSPITNRRQDEWGGSLENRMRFPLKVLETVRSAVGEDFILEITWSAEDLPGGYTLEESAAFLREASRYIDIVQLRAPEADPAHPTGFNLEETPFLHYAAYMKERLGDALIITTVGGYQYFDSCEKALAEGKTDMVTMARAWISNPDYGQLLVEGRAEDVVPCLRCNKCHGRGDRDPFQSVCSVNPLIGLEHKVGRMVRPPLRQKRVAVVGGGPAGLRCALDLATRGHSVVLYEAQSQLGGMIRHADFADFKWPLRRYKDYLIAQVEKNPAIQVKLATFATPRLLESEGYDAVVSALGAEPLQPRIAGLAENPEVYTAVQAFEFPEKLGRQVVVIGGGEVGVEAGMILAAKGHEVVVLEMRDKLAADSTKIHYRSMFQSAWEALPGFSSVLNATVIAVEDKAVRYRSRDGAEHSLPADSVVVSAGMRPKTDEALAFYGAAPEFYMIGDCKRPATVQQATRAAYAAAMRI